MGKIKTPDRILDEAIGKAWPRLADGVQVEMMDIPRIFRDVKLEVSGGMGLDEAVTKVRDRYRIDKGPVV